MADTKISALTASPYLVGSEEFPVVDAGLANEAATIAQINAGMLIYLNADYTLTSTTAQQQLFNTKTNGRLTIGETGLYRFEAYLYLTTMSATSGNGDFSVIGAGTATLSGQLLQSVGADGAIGTPTNRTGNGVAASAFGGNTLLAGTGTIMMLAVDGIFKVTATGTIIPSIGLTTANAAVVKAGSWFSVKKLAPASVYSVGAWD